MSPISDNEQLLFGGVAVSANYLTDTWLFNCSTKTWVEQNPANHPPPRSGFAMARLGSDDKVVMFGGITGIDQALFNDTWIYDLSENEWYNVTAEYCPTGRYTTAMAPIFGTNKELLFGGMQSYPNYACDTWIFNGDNYTWTELFPKHQPGARSCHAMSEVIGQNRILLFGGKHGEQINDTWFFDYNNQDWYLANTSINPPKRDLPMISPLDNDTILLFGGVEISNENDYGDTWLYNITEGKWNLKYPSAYFNPPRRHWGGMGAYYAEHAVVLFGGVQGDNQVTVLGDTWIYGASLYNGSGEYVSAPYDTGGSSSFQSLAWDASLPRNTSIGITLRTSETEDSLFAKEFLGPDGNNSTIYIMNNSVIWPGHNSDRWIQFKIIQASADYRSTPRVEAIYITYNRHPDPPNPKYPGISAWLNTTPERYSWTFHDNDSWEQNAFRWQLFNSPDNATSVDDSGVVNTSSEEYIPMEALPEGVWFWRVCTRDTDFDWGGYSGLRCFGIDHTPPNQFIPSASPACWTNTDVEITVNAMDELSGIGQIQSSIEGHSWQNQTNPFVIPDFADGVHTISVRALDKAGNYRDSSVKIYCDRTPPEPFQPEMVPAWSKDRAQVIFNTSDNVSGIDRYDLSLDGGDFYPVRSPAGIPDLSDGVHSVTVRAFDIAGNYRDETVLAYFDHGTPKLINISVTPSGWTRTDPIITFDGLDDTAGIDHFELSVDLGAYYSYSSPAILAGLSDGRHSVSIRIVDKAGNRAEQNIDVFVDRAPPQEFDPIAIPANWTNQAPLVAFDTSDALSGMSSYEVAVDGGNFSEAASPYTVRAPDGEHIVMVRAFDLAGNFRDASVKVFIDRTAPVNLTLNISDGKAKVEKSRVALLLSATDSVSGLESMCFSNDNIVFSDWEPFNFSKNWTLSKGAGDKNIILKVKDHAGNEATAILALSYTPKQPGGGSMTVIWLSVAGIILFTAASALVLRKIFRRKAPGK